MARLLFAINTYPDGGGIGAILENYVQELRGSHELYVAVVDERPGAKERLGLQSRQIRTLGYSNAINPLLMPASLAYAVTVGLWLRRVVRQTQPDLLLTQDALNLPIPALIASAGRPTRVIVMDHGTLTNVHDAEWLRMVIERLGGVKRRIFAAGYRADGPWRALRWRLAAKFADELWFTGQELERWFGRAGARAKRYWQTVPTDFVPGGTSERSAARAAFDLPLQATVFNYVGRLDGEKGLGTIVAALRSLPGAEDWYMLIAGDGSLKEWLEREISTAGLQRRVRLLGRLSREQVRQLHAASDFHVYAGTMSCGVSICLLEALAAGVVPIVSDVPALQRELVADAGWVFKAGDARGLALALHEALTSNCKARSALRVRVAAAIRQRPQPTIPDLIGRALLPSI